MYTAKKGFTIVLSALLLGSAFIENPVEARGAKDPRKTSSKKREPKRTPMSDKDILDPRKLNLNVAVPYLDSFDDSPKGQIFVTKRAAVGSADRELGGYYGEKGSPAYKRACMFFCPPGTKELDATYLYVIEEDGACTLGVRGIGWGETDTQYSDDGRRKYVTNISYRSKPTNIRQIAINGEAINLEIDFSQIGPPQGTNSKYFPRNKGMFGIMQTTQTSANLKAGYITDIHVFPAEKLIEAASPLSKKVVIQFPQNSWLPSKHVIEGDQLTEMKTVLSNCDEDW